MPSRPLDTAAVVREAVSAADEGELDELTMRRLGERMGVQAMALYRHIGGREALLDAMVAAMMDQLTDTMTPNTRSSTTGTAYLRDTAHDVRSLALTHPWLIRLMVLRPPPALGLSRPLYSLACTESFLEALDHRGFDMAASATTYRAFSAFLLAHLLIEASAPDDLVLCRPGRRGPPGPERLTDYPVMASHLELLAIENHRAEFEWALHGFLRSVG